MPGTAVSLTDDIRIKLSGAQLTDADMDELYRVEVEQSADLPSICKLIFHDENASLTSDTKIDLGKEIEVTLKTRTGTAYESVFKGEIVAIQPEYNETLSIMLTVIAFDKRHRLNRGRKTAVFKDSTDSDIMRKVIGDAGLTADVDATTYVNPQIIQDNLTDIAFLQMLARRNGKSITYVMDKVTVKAPPAGAPVATLVFGTDLRYFRPHMSTTGQVTGVKVKGWNVKDKVAAIGNATTPAGHPVIGYGKDGKAATNIAFGAAEWLETSSQAVTQDIAQKIAESRLNEINGSFIQGEARAFGSALIKPGALVKLDKLGARFTGDYRVTIARHSYFQGLFETEFTVEGVRPSTMSSMIAPQIDPPRLWYGVVTAIVTNNKDAEGKGRVKVKYPWLSDTLESHWARVVMVDGGAARGLMAMPEINDEVLVAFENGHFDVPYVVGILWNGQDAPPMTDADFLADGKVVKRQWKTRTGHILAFTEKTDLSTIEIIEKAALLKITLDGTNKKLEIANDDFKITIDKQGSKITIDGGTAADIEVKGKGIELKGTTVKLTATGEVTIKGSTVNIN